jgi:hypothetical protein
MTRIYAYLIFALLLTATVLCVAAIESGHLVVSRLLGLPVAGSTIEDSHGNQGLTWATNDEDEPGAETVADLCAMRSALRIFRRDRDKRLHDLS